VVYVCDPFVYEFPGVALGVGVAAFEPAKGM
jgi:hypothetical protein